MIRLKALRIERGLSGQALSRLASLNPAHLSQIEHRRFIPYAGQLERLRAALGYNGDAKDLLEEVSDVERA